MYLSYPPIKDTYSNDFILNNCLISSIPNDEKSYLHELNHLSYRI